MSSIHSEIERKFDGLLLQPLTSEGLPQVDRLVPGESHELEAVYYDTDNLSLLSHGITFRRREGGGDPGWHLKLPQPDGSRTEVQHPLTAAGTAPPPELLRRAQVYAKGAELRPVAHLRTTRKRTLLLDAHGRTLAEVAADRVAARALNPVADASVAKAAVQAEVKTPAKTGAKNSNRAGPKATAKGAGVAEEPQTELTTWSETEVELVDPASADSGTALLDAVTERFAAQGVHPARISSKLAHALGAPTPSPLLRRQDVSSFGPTAEALVNAMRQHTDQLLELDQAVRADEPDAVHQMRITTRRLRSLLRLQRGLADRSQLDPLADELRWLGQLLGAHRDPQTLGERLAAQAEGLPAAANPGPTAALVQTWTEQQCRAARRELLHAMDSTRYFLLVDALELTAAQPPLRPGRHHGPKAAHRLLHRETRRVSRRMAAAERQPYGSDRDSALHQVRKAAKRARYGAESLAPVLDRAGRSAKQLKKIQKHLGRHQDAVAAEAVLGQLAHAPRATPVAAFAYGILFARQRRDADADVSAAARAARKAARA
jgi:CHAD domain-containing protein